MAVADVNGDGVPDLLVANQCSSNGCANGTAGVLLGNGDGTFQPAVAIGSGGFYSLYVASGDLNGDGKTDILLASECAEINCANGSAAVVGVILNLSTLSTATAVASSVNPSVFGQAVVFTATVSSTTNRVPTGSVTFLDGTTSLGSPSLNSSAVATLSTSTLELGTHSITATYNGDSNFAASTSAC